MAEAKDQELSSVFTAFEAVCGPANVRFGRLEDQLDGIEPRIVVAPSDTAEVSSVLRIAANADLHVVARGTGTKLRWGNPPSKLDLILDTRRMNKILEHVAGDLVVRAQAGVTLFDLQKALREYGQRLALDPPGPMLGKPGSGTLGGVVASNASGPLRYRFGTVRDLLIGSTVVLVDGTVSHSGGKVVKNVAGYDLGKLFAGSFGTLGIVTEVIFRLHPLHPERKVLCLTVNSTEAAGEAVALLSASQLVPSALELRWDIAGRHGLIQVLFEGKAASIEGQYKSASELWEGLGTIWDAPDLVSIDFGAAGASKEQPVAQTEPSTALTECLARISALPSQIGEVLRCIEQVANNYQIYPEVGGHVGTGITQLRFTRQPCPPPQAGTHPQDRGQKILGMLTELRELLSGEESSVVVIQSPPDTPYVLNRWGPVRGLALMESVKDRFDPSHRLAPGRFVGGI